MLSLTPPYPVVDGYALLPDHEDPDLWYALPSAPRLAVRDGAPALSLTQYLGSRPGTPPVAGGVLSMTTELVVPPEVLAVLPARLADVRGFRGTPRVVPAPFDTGAVELVVLGRSSGTAGEPADGGAPAAPGGDFRVTFAGSGRPSMGGTNEASFQLLLDEPAAEMIGRCLDLPELPVLVTYVMTYAALRPAFTVDLHADWSRVYSSLRSRLTTNAWFVAADVDTAVTSSLEEAGVDLDVVVEGTGEGDRAAAERTRQQLLDWVLDKLFVPMAPPSLATTIGQVVDDAVWSIARAVVPGASYRLKVVREDELRRMDLRARERVAEARELRPQGTVGGLLHALRLDEDGTERPGWPATRARLLQQVELSGFPRLDVGVEVVDRFATDGLRSVQVDLARGAGPEAAVPAAPVEPDEQLTFTAPGQRKAWVVDLLEEAQREHVWDRPYLYRVGAEFDPSSPLRPAGPVPSALSAWRTRRSTDLLVDPREAYAVTDVTVTVAPLFSFALFAAVTVELRPGSGAGAPAAAGVAGAAARGGRVVLDADHPVLHWLFASPPDDVGFAWRATYHRPVESGGDVVTAWTDAVEPFVSLPDPMPEKLVVTFFVDLPWDRLASAMLELRYDDAAAGVHHPEETVLLDPTTRLVPRTLSIASGGAREISYRLTLQPLVGPLVDGSWRTTTEDRVVVDSRLVEERQVAVRVLGTLEEQRLLRATLRVEVRDPADGRVREGADLALAPGATTPPFVHRLGDPPVRAVWWRLTTVDANGFVAAQPWGSGTGDLLVVDLRSRTVTG